MPIFEYHCRKCGNKFEAIVNSSNSTASCKGCGSKEVEQLLSVFVVAGASSGATIVPEPGPCGACGVPRRGMCGE